MSEQEIQALRLRERRASIKELREQMRRYALELKTIPKRRRAGRGFFLSQAVWFRDASLELEKQL